MGIIRNINIDIVKTLAVFFVLSVHFFLNNNFYSTVIDCPRMYIMCFMRTFFMMCVPLFLLITGFLMNKKEFSAKYYKGLNRVISPYIIISIITLIAEIFLSKYGIFTLDKWNHYLNDFIDFHIVGYGWYVDMYIGLFLLIPFLNQCMTTKMNDLILVATLLFLTVLPSLCSSPTFIISKWDSLWPITYYVIGAYIARHGVSISLKNLLTLFIFFYLTFSTINVFITYSQTWNVHGIDSWGGFENTITSVLFFLICLKINFNKLNQNFRNIISDIAKMSLGIYLSSYLFDKIIYYYFNQYIKDTTAKLEWYIVIVPIVFMLSLLMAKYVDIIYKRINSCIAGNISSEDIR